MIAHETKHADQFAGGTHGLSGDLPDKKVIEDEAQAVENSVTGLSLDYRTDKFGPNASFFDENGDIQQGNASRGFDFAEGNFGSSNNDSGIDSSDPGGAEGQFVINVLFDPIYPIYYNRVSDFEYEVAILSNYLNYHTL